MTDERKREYTRRITQANPTGLLVILYEMYDEYMQEAAGAADKVMRKDGIRKARQCLNQLISTLDMEYDISMNLLQIYLFITKEMARAEVRNEDDTLQNCRRLIGKLRSAYETISVYDTSGPVMENPQEVFAGLTYGRNSMSESMGIQGNRGFLV